MKIKCICLDDKNRPSEIPVEKWPIKDKVYHITWIYNQMNQPGIKGVELKEFDISMCDPYNSFRLNRFAISLSDLDKFIKLMEESNELNGLDISSFVEELIEDGKLILQD